MRLIQHIPSVLLLPKEGHVSSSGEPRAGLWEPSTPKAGLEDGGVGKGGTLSAENFKIIIKLNKNHSSLCYHPQF